MKTITVLLVIFNLQGAYLQAPSPPSQNSDISLEAGSDVTSRSTTEESCPASESRSYPNPTGRFAPCRLLISEVVPRNDYNSISFIEIAETCHNPRDVTTKTLLSDYYVLLIKSGNPPQIIFVADLSGKKLRLITDTGPPSRRRKTVGVFVIGDNVPGAMQIRDVQMISNNDGQLSIPNADNNAIAAVLVHIPDREAGTRDERRQLLLNRVNNICIATAVLPSTIIVLEKYLQDIVSYGNSCPVENCWLFNHLLAAKPVLEDDDEAHLPIPETELDLQNRRPYQSLSRCSETALPMQVDSFEISQPTPFAHNECSQQSTSRIIFNLRGCPLQHTAQKIILNLHRSMEYFLLNPGEITGTALQLTGKFTGVSDKTVTKIIQNHAVGHIATPGHKRPHPNLEKINQIDEFRVEIIKRTILKTYEENRPPLAIEIYKKQWKLSVMIGRILRKLNFVYGRINLREVIIQRPDIVAWRAKYLRVLLDNSRGPTPLPIVYTDETWIDPHARTAKGWFLKSCKYSERKMYTYQKNKVGRGARIIVMHAGGKDGFVEGVGRVYGVTQKDLPEDYHRNIDGKAYISWFNALLDALDSKGPHIIVVDNAPYHGLSDIPKSNARKNELYTWLKNNLEPDKVAGFKTEKEYRVKELRAMVDLKKGDKNYYRIDQEAARRGHKVLRLPPYSCDLNPIEYVWKDVKHEVRKSNTDQNTKTVVARATEIMASYTSEQWSKHVNHVKNLQEYYWKMDGLIDDYLDRNPHVVVPIQDDDDDDVEEEEDESTPARLTPLGTQSVRRQTSSNRVNLPGSAGNPCNSTFPGRKRPGTFAAGDWYRKICDDCSTGFYWFFHDCFGYNFKFE